MGCKSVRQVETKVHPCSLSTKLNPMDLYLAWKNGRSPTRNQLQLCLIQWRKQDYHQISSVANKDTVHLHIEILRLLDNCHCFWTIHLGHSHRVEKGQIFSFWSFLKNAPTGNPKSKLLEEKVLLYSATNIFETKCASLMQLLLWHCFLQQLSEKNFGPSSSNT